ncbi:MAG: 5'/3'-nucleotidase SurE, partial [Planctomycetota bacterium]|nr:5'/3'-nucleotidase SurE [Planctomycetota bacterium]
MTGFPKNKKPSLLLTNDDGCLKLVCSLDRFINLLKKWFSVTVVAPIEEQSASSHSITILNPIFINKIETDFYGIAGTPTDCIKIALGFILKKKPDYVISGINSGANVGLDVFYSGTVAAAIEASFWGVTSFAISVERDDNKNLDFNKIYQTGYRVVNSLIKAKPPRGSVFNINIPATNNHKGIKFTRQDLRLPRDNFIKGIDPRGRHYYWMKPATGASSLVGSDISAIKSGYISVTPLKADFTDRQTLAKFLGMG